MGIVTRVVDETPTIVVDDNTGDYSKPQLFFRLASAYADSSHHVFQSIVDGSLAQTFSHAQSGHFLFDHSIELFLKGSILKAGKQIDNTHHLDQLYNFYRKLYPKKTFK